MKLELWIRNQKASSVICYSSSFYYCLNSLRHGFLTNEKQYVEEHLLLIKKVLMNLKYGSWSQKGWLFIQ